MKRLSYLYCIIPLYVLLSCCSSMELLMGPYWAAVAGAVILMIVWAVVWCRLYSSKAMRPEFSLLAVLPHGFYFSIMAAAATMPQLRQADFMEPLQPIYIALWLAGMFVVYRGCKADPPAAPGDALRKVMAVLILLYGWAGWTNCSSDMMGRLLP